MLSISKQKFMGKDGEKGDDGNSGYESSEQRNTYASISVNDEPETLNRDSVGTIISLSNWKLSLVIDNHYLDKTNDNSTKAVPEESAKDSNLIANHKEGYALLPQVFDLYNAGNIEEARRMASDILAKYPITPALKLLLESDLTLGEKTFCRAMEAYLNHLKLSKKKKRNFPIDRKFLSTIFDTATERNFFKPVPLEFIPAPLRDLSVLELMIKMTDVKKELHLHADLLTALFLALKRQNSPFNT